MAESTVQHVLSASQASPSFCATGGGLQSFMVSPTKRYPCCFNKSAATEESTPPLMAQATRVSWGLGAVDMGGKVDSYLGHHVPAHRRGDFFPRFFRVLRHSPARSGFPGQRRLPHRAP